jgi:hypothetical protein
MVAEAKKVDQSDPTAQEQKRTETSLDATPSTKKISLSLVDPAKKVVIGDDLGEK